MLCILHSSSTNPFLRMVSSLHFPGLHEMDRPRYKLNITKNRLNMFPEIPDFFSKYVEIVF